MGGPDYLIQWSITNNDGVTQFVGPSEAPNLQVNFDGNALAPDSPNGYYWVIRGDSELYTFVYFPYSVFNALIGP